MGGGMGGEMGRMGGGTGGMGGSTGGMGGGQGGGMGGYGGGSGGGGMDWGGLGKLVSGMQGAQQSTGGNASYGDFQNQCAPQPAQEKHMGGWLAVQLGTMHNYLVLVWTAPCIL